MKVETKVSAKGTVMYYVDGKRVSRDVAIEAASATRKTPFQIIHRGFRKGILVEVTSTLDVLKLEVRQETNRHDVAYRIEADSCTWVNSTYGRKTRDGEVAAARAEANKIANAIAIAYINGEYGVNAYYSDVEIIEAPVTFDDFLVTAEAIDYAAEVEETCAAVATAIDEEGEVAAEYAVNVDAATEVEEANVPNRANCTVRLGEKLWAVTRDYPFNFNIEDGKALGYTVNVDVYYPEFDSIVTADSSPLKNLADAIEIARRMHAEYENARVEVYRFVRDESNEHFYAINWRGEESFGDYEYAVTAEAIDFAARVEEVCAYNHQLRVEFEKEREQLKADGVKFILIVSIAGIYVNTPTYYDYKSRYALINFGGMKVNDNEWTLQTIDGEILGAGKGIDEWETFIENYKTKPLTKITSKITPSGEVKYFANGEKISAKRALEILIAENQPYYYVDAIGKHGKIVTKDFASPIVAYDYMVTLAKTFYENYNDADIAVKRVDGEESTTLAYSRGKYTKIYDAELQAYIDERDANFKHAS